MAGSSHFLESYIMALLNDIGLGDLTDEQKARYVPQLIRQAEDRIGIELIPRLTDEQLKQFTSLANDDAASADQWKTFWTSAIPDFEQELDRVLSEFSDEAREIMTP